jgi:hypothetical protein
MLRLLGIVLIFVLAGCGARPAGQGAPADPGSVLSYWIERMRESESVRFDIETKVEGPRPTWLILQGELSPMSDGAIMSGGPEPVSRLVRRSDYADGSGVVETEAIERDSVIYMRDSRLRMPVGKSWADLQLNVVPNEYTSVRLSLRDVSPSMAFADIDRSSLTISGGQEEQLDGVQTTKYELSAGRAVETNPNTARGKRVMVTVWIGPDDLPLKVVQVSSGDGGHTYRKTSKFTAWNSTPAVQLPAPDQIADPKDVIWPQR